jgi:hypothetical protein
MVAQWTFPKLLTFYQFQPGLKAGSSSLKKVLAKFWPSSKWVPGINSTNCHRWWDLGRKVLVLENVGGVFHSFVRRYVKGFFSKPIEGEGTFVFCFSKKYQKQVFYRFKRGNYIHLIAPSNCHPCIGNCLILETKVIKQKEKESDIVRRKQN